MEWGGAEVPLSVSLPVALNRDADAHRCQRRAAPRRAPARPGARPLDRKDGDFQAKGEWKGGGQKRRKSEPQRAAALSCQEPEMYPAVELELEDRLVVSKPVDWEVYDGSTEQLGSKPRNRAAMTVI